MDPNQPAGTPRDYWVWLAPDWSDYQEGDKAPAGKTGWTRVKIRETVYNDGKIVRNVLDANGAPLAASGVAAGGTEQPRALDATPQYDPDQSKRFKDQQSQSQRGDQEGDTRGPQTGPQREVYRGGKWVVEDNPLYRPDGTTTASSETQKNEAELNRERAWNADPANIPNGASGFRDTHAEAAARKQKAADAEKAERAKDDTTTVDVSYEGTGQNRRKITTYKSGRKVTEASPTDARVKETKFAPDGTKITVYEDGTETKEAPKPSEAPGAGAMPEGAPVPSGKLGEAAADLQAFDAWLEPQVRSGNLTAARADQLREQRRAYWQTALSEQQGIVNAQRQSFADQSQQRSTTMADLSNRRSNATQIANQASGDLMSQIGNFGDNPGGASLAAAIRASRANAQDFVTMTGANREVPEIVPGPALATVNGMQLPGGASGLNVRPNTAPPNAIGAGQLPPQPAPAGPMPAPVFTPQPMAPPPVSEQALDNRQAMVAPQPWFLAGASRGHTYDPTAAVQAMIADPRMDNNVIRAVVAEQYPGYPIDDLLGAA